MRPVTSLVLWLCCLIPLTSCGGRPTGTAIPESAEAYFNRGLAYASNGQYEEAITDYTRALEINPRYALAFYHRGVAYDNKGQHEQAIADYTRAFDINPSLAEVYDVRWR